MKGAHSLLFVVGPHPDAIGDRIDEPAAARYARMGSALAGSVRTSIAVPFDAALAVPGICTRPYSSERSLRQIVNDHAVVVIPAPLFTAHPSLTSAAARLVADVTGRARINGGAVQAADFFICGSERERDRWLSILTASGRIGRRARTIGNLRRLIDVVDRDAIDKIDETADCSARERAVDALRLYCTSTSRQPRGWAWAPPTLAARARRIVREQGVLALAAKAVARVRGPAAAAGAWGPSRPHLEPDLPARLASVTTVAELHELLSRHEILGPARRFMDLEIDISNRCNIRCKMCYFSFDEVFHARPVYLRPDTFAPLAESILPHAKAVMLSLGSEPLLSPHFGRILELAARHHVPELGFYTNGLLMNERVDRRHRRARRHDRVDLDRRRDQGDVRGHPPRRRLRPPVAERARAGAAPGTGAACASAHPVWRRHDAAEHPGAAGHRHAGMAARRRRAELLPHGRLRRTRHGRSVAGPVTRRCRTNTWPRHWHARASWE